MLRSLIIMVLFLNTSGVWASGMGWSMYPILTDKKLLSAEIVGDFTAGGGAGFQARYTQRLNSKMTLEGGLAYTSGERAGKLFLGFDYELFPDYLKQPRISVKGNYSNGKEYEERVNRIDAAPMVSKGFNFWGNEAFPYLAIPMGVNLNSASRTYGFYSNINVGITGKVPWEKYEHLLTQLEAQFNLSNSYSGIFIGLSFPIN
ncbi:MAG: hypothetical protein DRQ88_00955 [Epsilonproteobacteria bacterium]|nr:MAG: hypothetical protein DRQ89_05020 [Campylobacterota bacterium]RLA67862.1 MAG: hypothetical protein DRQ88_00955 [Campylobacterota bacterium]